MCSTSVQRLAEIGRAIDDLAAQAEAHSREAGEAGRAGATDGAGPASRAGSTGAAERSGAAAIADVPASALSGCGQATDDTDQIMRRLADLWAKLAQLDPEVAKRLPTYEA
jgi:hypothetical protein